MADLTPEDMTRPRVPLAELPGLDSDGLRLAEGWALYDEVHDRDAVVRVAAPDTYGSTWRSRSALHLDLSDAATRDRCARWLAQRVGLEVGCTAPGWWCQQDVWVLAVKRSHAQVRGPVAHVYSARPRWSIYVHGGKRTQVPALAALDPDDDRRLPDGSRWVDVAALALVCRAQGVIP